jgi:hypothetical protein
MNAGFLSAEEGEYMAGSSPEHEVGDGIIFRSGEEVNRASFSGSRFLFRGDDSGLNSIA